MEEKKGLIAEFKEFIARGNVVDMAVGLVVGAAFTAVVNSLVQSILSPIVGYLIGGLDFSGFVVTLPEVMGKSAVDIPVGAFINSVVSFLITAVAIFAMIKIINKLKRKQEETEEEAEEAEEELAPELQLLTEIRDLLKGKSEE